MRIDPIADKLLTVSAFIALVELRLAPAWMVVVIVGREFAVTGLRGIAAEQGVTIEARSWGKLKMVTQCACIVALLLSHPQDKVDDQLSRLMQPIGLALLWGTVLISAVSALDYLMKFWGVLQFEEKK